jgi:hypothetical protein
MKLRTIALLVSAVAYFAVSAAPAFAWWQFVSWKPDGERKVSSRFPNEKACEAALKQLDAQLAKQYPSLYPRVGSCEEYR